MDIWMENILTYQKKCNALKQSSTVFAGNIMKIIWYKVKKSKQITQWFETKKVISVEIKIVLKTTITSTSKIHISRTTNYIFKLINTEKSVNTSDIQICRKLTTFFIEDIQ